jgi:hypothetical protein
MTILKRLAGPALGGSILLWLALAVLPLDAADVNIAIRVHNHQSTAAGGSLDAAAIASGTFAAARLPNPSATTLGGIQSKIAVANQWISSISTSGVPGTTQPNFTNIAGVASNAQMPTPGASALGGVQSLAPVANQFIESISTSGVPGTRRPADADLTFTDVTNGNATTAAHGFQAKFPNDATLFQNGAGSWVPLASGITTGSVLFASPTGTIDSDPSDFLWDPTLLQLRLGNRTTSGVGVDVGPTYGSLITGDLVTTIPAANVIATGHTIGTDWTGNNFDGTSVIYGVVELMRMNFTGTMPFGTFAHNSVLDYNGGGPYGVFNGAEHAYIQVSGNASVFGSITTAISRPTQLNGAVLTYTGFHAQLYINDSTSFNIIQGPIAARYGILQNGPSDQNWFAGKISASAAQPTVQPAARLDFGATLIYDQVHIYRNGNSKMGIGGTAGGTGIMVQYAPVGGGFVFGHMSTTDGTTLTSDLFIDGGGNFTPYTDIGRDLGTTTLRWKTIYVSTGLGTTAIRPTDVFAIGLTVGAASTGTRITQYIVYTPSLTPTATAATIKLTEQTFTVTGISTADKLYMNPPSTVANSLCPPTTIRASATNTVAIGFSVMTAAACTPAAGTYNIVAIRN